MNEAKTVAELIALSPLYVSHKKVKRTPMNRLDYNDYRNWELPEDENGEDEGYLVEYTDGGTPNHPDHEGYISWSPKKQFDDGYTEAAGVFDFGFALKLLKVGSKLQRNGWNGKNMFVVYQKGYPSGIACNKQTAEAWGLEEGGLFKVEPYLQIRMVNGSHAMWVPSINDVLAEDWSVVK